MTLIRSTGFLRDLGCNSEGTSQGALSSLRALQWILLAELRKEYNRRPGTPAQAYLECLQASVTSGPHQWPLGTFLPPPKVQLWSEQEGSLVSGLKESAHALWHNSHCGHPGREPQGIVPSTGSAGPGLVLGFSERTPMVSMR